MTDFPTDAEREAIPCSRRCAERGSDLYGHTSICEEERSDTLAALAPMIRAREAAAWDAGAEAAWDAGFDAGYQYARAVNPEWPDMPTNPFEGADDDRD